MAEQKTEDKPKKKASFKSKMLIFSLMVTAVVFLPSTLVIAVCMIPAIVAGMVDRQKQKTAWITVGAMNLAGTLPAWFMLFEAGHTMDVALALVMKPGVLMMAYGAAAIGWVIYNNVTPLVAGVVVAKNERRLKEIAKRQKELVRKWGEEVGMH